MPKTLGSKSFEAGAGDRDGRSVAQMGLERLEWGAVHRVDESGGVHSGIVPAYIGVRQ